MGNANSIRKINFEDMQKAVEKKNFTIISTLKSVNQKCLIKNTTPIDDEESILNESINKNMNRKIIIYGLNACDESVHNKYKQLMGLGLHNLYIYPGGLFEWLLLQDIYGFDLFPTTVIELDHLKFKGSQIIDILMITDY